MAESLLLEGNCLDVLKDIPDNSVDSIVTDPPYGLSFMGKKWDYDVPTTAIWEECLRVLKPGGHLLAFFGTRTYHRGVVRIEDAGFEIRDQIMWLYGSGFPKSHDVSKGIDKKAGAEREVVGKKDVGPDIRGNNFKNDSGERMIADLTAPATDEAKQWSGWGTALKPANEPIVVARKPLEKGLTIAQNVVKWGTGALNIDASRIGTTDQLSIGSGKIGKNTFGDFAHNNPGHQHSQGRWPANVLLDEEAAAALDLQTNEKQPTSRFFYVAKASKRERNAGLEGESKEKQGARPNSKDSTGKFPDHDHRETGGNNHPTVKPVKLMEYLITLVTPDKGTILDPFMGSGSTGVAAKNLDRDFIGIEMSPEYFEIAQKRVG